MVIHITAKAPAGSKSPESLPEHLFACRKPWRKDRIKRSHSWTDHRSGQSNVCFVIDSLSAPGKNTAWKKTLTRQKTSETCPGFSAATSTVPAFWYGRRCPGFAQSGMVDQLARRINTKPLVGGSGRSKMWLCSETVSTSFHYASGHRDVPCISCSNNTRLQEKIIQRSSRRRLEQVLQMSYTCQTEGHSLREHCGR